MPKAPSPAPAVGRPVSTSAPEEQRTLADNARKEMRRMSWGLKSSFAVLGFGFVLALATLALQMMIGTGMISNPPALFGGAVVLMPVFSVAGWPILLQLVKSNRSWPTDVIRAHGFILLLLNVILLMLALARGGGIPHVPLWCTLFSLLPVHFPVIEWACAVAALASAVMGLAKPWSN